MINTNNQKKEPIPSAIRNLVWSTYISSESRIGKCFCCGVEPITCANFDCGHVIARCRGGQATVENLRPICGNCNGSMHTQNMFEFMAKHGMSMEHPNDPIFGPSYAYINKLVDDIVDSRNNDCNDKYVNDANLIKPAKNNNQTKDVNPKDSSNKGRPKVKYRCPKCKKEFNRKHTYEYHIFKKKFSCTGEPIEYDIGKQKPDKSQVPSSHEYPKCHNEYATKSNLTRHIKSYCTVSDIDTESNSDISDDSNSVVDNRSSFSSKPSECDDAVSEDVPEESQNRTGRRPKKLANEPSEAPVPADKKQCSFCKKTYSKTNFSKHEKICRLKALRDAAIKEEAYMDLRREIDQLKAELKKLR